MSNVGAEYPIALSPAGFGAMAECAVGSRLRNYCVVSTSLEEQGHELDPAGEPDCPRPGCVPIKRGLRVGGFLLCSGPVIRDWRGEQAASDAPKELAPVPHSITWSARRRTQRRGGRRRRSSARKT